jgi:hypothetical protein
MLRQGAIHGRPRPDHHRDRHTKASDDQAEAQAIANACEAGALPYVSDVGLTAKRLRSHR